ncbi:MAG TPA: substrate-binding domain-containing protein [Roseiflexaceae bacterium]|nr:substrate-binding domain-containing protein [Roseiflexaceae bacterium]
MDDTRKKVLLSRRDFLRLGGGLTLTAMLAACGAPAGGTPTQAPAEPAAPTAAPEPTPVPAEPAEPTVAVAEFGSSDKPTVFWHGLGGADGKTMVTMLETYAGQGQAVRSETYDWNVFYQKLPTSVVAGTPPDLAIMHEWAIQQFATQGLLQPVDEIFFTSGLIPKDDFNQSLLETVSYDGKVMGVPFDNHGWGLFYNTKLITDAGLDPNNLPKNQAEFLTWADKLTVDEAGKHPSEDGFNPDKVKVWAIHASWQRFTMPSTMWQFGGGIITEDRTKSLLDSEGTIAAIQFWHDLMYKYRVCPPAVPGTPPGGDLYKTNSLVFWWDGSWSLNFFKDNPDVEAVTKAGFLNSLAPDGKQAAKMASHLLVVPVGVKDDALERAKNLIKWLSDNGKTWATSGQVPARLSVQQDPEVQSIWSVKVFAEEFKAIGRTDVPHKAATEIQTTWEAAVSGALANTTSVKDALAEGSKQIQAILDRG